MATLLPSRKDVDGWRCCRFGKANKIECNKQIKNKKKSLCVCFINSSFAKTRKSLKITIKKKFEIALSRFKILRNRQPCQARSEGTIFQFALLSVRFLFLSFSQTIMRTFYCQKPNQSQSPLPTKNFL